MVNREKSQKVEEEFAAESQQETTESVSQIT
jgi:hypothetical protein